jgi:hypothetical protein
VFFSGYRPDPSSREERVLAVRLGAVAGGWDAVYRAVFGSTMLAHTAGQPHPNGAPHERAYSPPDGVTSNDLEKPA